jgi:hypothetical protein
VAVVCHFSFGLSRPLTRNRSQSRPFALQQQTNVAWATYRCNEVSFYFLPGPLCSIHVLMLRRTFDPLKVCSAPKKHLTISKAGKSDHESFARLEVNGTKKVDLSAITFMDAPWQMGLSSL